MNNTIIVRRDDLELILTGLDDYWITFPEHQPAIDRLRKATIEKDKAPGVTPTQAGEPPS